MFLFYLAVIKDVTIYYGQSFSLVFKRPFLIFIGFPLQRGRRSMQHTPSLGYSFCQVIRLEPYVFYPDKPVEAQITVNHLDTSDKSYVHDASVSWVEHVNYDKFTACVMTAGFNERMSYSNVTVDWLAYQGAPVGGVAGVQRISQWWTGTTCETVTFPTVSSFLFFFSLERFWYDLKMKTSEKHKQQKKGNRVI